MPREIARAPQHPSRTIMDRTVQEAVSQVQNLPGVASYRAPAAPPLDTTTAITNADGSIATSHPFMLGIDALGATETRLNVSGIRIDYGF